MRFITSFWAAQGGGMVSDIAKAVGLIALLTVVAANVISSQTARFDSERLSQVTAAAAKGQPIDPLVTGSIRKSAREVRLDPCALPR